MTQSPFTGCQLLQRIPMKLHPSLQSVKLCSYRVDRVTRDTVNREIRDEKVKRKKVAPRKKINPILPRAPTNLKKSVATHPYIPGKLYPCVIGDRLMRTATHPPFFVFIFSPSPHTAVVPFLSDSCLVLGAMVCKGYWNLYAKLNEYRIKKCLRGILEMRCQISEVVSLWGKFEYKTPRFMTLAHINSYQYML